MDFWTKDAVLKEKFPLMGRFKLTETSAEKLFRKELWLSDKTPTFKAMCLLTRWFVMERLREKLKQKIELKFISLPLSRQTLLRRLFLSKRGLFFRDSVT